MADSVKINDCLTITKRGTDLKWDLGSAIACRPIIAVIRDTVGKGGDSLYSLPRAKTDVSKCDVEAEARCALDAAPEECKEKFVNECRND